MHTAGLKIGFSMQNQIVTTLRNRLTVDTWVKLLSVEMCTLRRKGFKRASGVWKTEEKRIISLKEGSSDSSEDVS